MKRSVVVPAQHIGGSMGLAVAAVAYKAFQQASGCENQCVLQQVLLLLLLPLHK